MLREERSRSTVGVATAGRDGSTRGTMLPRSDRLCGTRTARGGEGSQRVATEGSGHPAGDRGGHVPPARLTTTDLKKYVP